MQNVTARPDSRFDPTMSGAQMDRIADGDLDMRASIFALCLCLAASPALAQTAARPATPPPATVKPAKPSAKPAAKRPPAPKPAAFLATDPSDIITLFSTMGAKATRAKSEDGMVFLDVTAPGAAFGVQMIGCDSNGRTCRAMALFSVFDKPGISLAQINDFNRSQFACRGVLTPDGQPSVMYAALVDARLNQDQTRAHLGVWQGCLKGFGEFVADPVEFLSKPHG